VFISAGGRACITSTFDSRASSDETLIDEKVWLGIYNEGNKRKR